MGLIKLWVWGLKCERCGHVWFPSKLGMAITNADNVRRMAAILKMCPKCKSREWDIPPTEVRFGKPPRERPLPDI